MVSKLVHDLMQRLALRSVVLLFTVHHLKNICIFRKNIYFYRQ